MRRVTRSSRSSTKPPPSMPLAEVEKLGKNSSCQSTQSKDDPSHPHNKYVGNLEQIRKVVLESSPETRQLLNKECSVIFECRICRTMFRSLVNFLCHKTEFCKNETKDSKRDIIMPSLDAHKKRDTENLLPNQIVLDPMPFTNEAFQNVWQKPQEGERVVGDYDFEVNTFSCTFCTEEFLSRQTLNSHVKKHHGNLITVSVCPCCKTYFSSSWSVYRHLYKTHRKTSEQVRKLRPRIVKKHVTQEEYDKSKSVLEVVAAPPEEKNQNKAFMEDLVGHESLQWCSECGKHFGRNAALISHIATCHKKKTVPRANARSLKGKARVPQKLGKGLNISSSSNVTEGNALNLKKIDQLTIKSEPDISPTKFDQLIVKSEPDSPQSCNSNQFHQVTIKSEPYSPQSCDSNEFDQMTIKPEPDSPQSCDSNEFDQLCEKPEPDLPQSCDLNKFDQMTIKPEPNSPKYCVLNEFDQLTIKSETDLPQFCDNSKRNDLKPMDDLDIKSLISRYEGDIMIPTNAVGENILDKFHRNVFIISDSEDDSA